MKRWAAKWWALLRYGSRHGCDSPEVLALFAHRQQQLIVNNCLTWCLLSLTAALALSLGQLLAILTSCKAGLVGVGTLLPFAVPPAVVLLLLGFSKARCISPRALPPLLCLGCALVFGYFAWRIHANVELNVQSALLEDLPDVWALLQSDPAAKANLQQWIQSELSRKGIWTNLLYEVVVIESLWLAAFPAWALLLPAVPFVTHLLLCVLSPAVPLVAEPLCAAALVGGFLVLSSLKGMHQFFHEFMLDHCLQSALEREAQSLRLANEAKAAQRAAAQKADSMINHILKNIMADAVGCLELFQADEGLEHLQRARECLTRGMGWCKKRQAMVRLTLGQYTPLLLPTQLQQFGEAVVCQRAVALYCPPACVCLDPTLCDIVCDNALSNAFRHGHPEDPQVSLTVRLEPAELGSARCRLSFAICNRANPARPPVSPAFVAALLAAGGGAPPCDGLPSLSDRIGLEHIHTAAQAQNMAVSLQQDGEVVTFTATMEVDLHTPLHEAATVAEVDVPAFQRGLRFACIDDSDVARRLMTHSLQTYAKAESVQVFGQRATDVDAFLSFVLSSSADVVLLDQNLEYPQTTFLGTDLVRHLLGAGFPGLVCLRTANAEECDRDFYRRCGVHCVIGKDVSGPVMVAQLMSAYAQHITATVSSLTDSCSSPQGLLSCGSGSWSPLLSRSGGCWPMDRRSLPGYVAETGE
eukprot:EG_transcript_3706